MIDDRQKRDNARTKWNIKERKAGNWVELQTGIRGDKTFYVISVDGFQEYVYKKRKGETLSLGEEDALARLLARTATQFSGAEIGGRYSVLNGTVVINFSYKSADRIPIYVLKRITEKTDELLLLEGTRK